MVRPGGGRHIGAMHFPCRLRPRPRPRYVGYGLLLLVVALVSPSPVHAQADAARFGISVGGTSTIGIILEYEDGQGSTELTLGTWSFRDVAVSVVRKQRFGVEQVRPTIGIGLWGVVAFPSEGRASAALVIRAPLGAEWDIASSGTHFVTLDINVNRALWVRRSDPEDLAPLNRRLVPLPGAAYRWRSN